MRSDIAAFYSHNPATIALHEAFEHAVLTRFDAVTIDVQKTQISFRCPGMFAALWPPNPRFKTQTKDYIGLSVSLERIEPSPRIAQCVQVSPNRFTHHLLIHTPDQIDDFLLSLVAESYFRAQKRKKPLK